ncbi:Pinene synthase [Quillaja saponaria]|uniref:Pinene synthase n=1 Tax=Quillaja saponaria TaxID=32244 RepID=A0AAD7PS38_QUISA|nr:Pinene synthase [Quillaja saponaria]
MALCNLSLNQTSNFTKVELPCTERNSLFVKIRSSNLSHLPLQYERVSTDTISDKKEIVRGSNYRPTIYHYGYIQSLNSEYAVEESYGRKHDKLKREVRMMLKQVVNPIDQLDLIDVLQRLGLSYHFQEEITEILDKVYHNNIVSGKDKQTQKNLHTSALEFRLLRQHGYNASPESFNSLKDNMGSFKPCITTDIKGMLSLYEASYHSIEGESILDEVRDFTRKHLNEFVNRNKDDERSEIVSHALSLPLHWRMQRLEAWWFIDVYERRDNMNPVLLELAKLDFNMVQATHQDDLKDVSRWWTGIGLGEKLNFPRDTLMQDFFGIVGMMFDPHLGYCRRMVAKVNTLVNVIDDIYDVYGTLEELELFTDAIDRWDTSAMDRLPEYMKLCYLALHNTVNEIAFDILKKQGLHIIGHLKKAWAGLSKSYLIEAKWYHTGYIPTLQEYIDNGYISVAAPIALLHSYFFVANPITGEALGYLEEYPNIIRSSSIICRLSNDLRPFLGDLGDVPKSIECYMKETGASEEDARKHIRSLISKTWKKMNEEHLVAASSPFSQPFIEVATNAARGGLCMYQEGDNYLTQYPKVKDWINFLLVHPIGSHTEE